jgi:hypothetical protein
VRILILIAAMLATISCSKDIQNSDAVKQGVLDYLHARNSQTGLNMDAMQIDVTSISFQRDVARAAVIFTPKGMPGGGMEMNATLDRKGAKWVVRGHLEGGSVQHGAGGMPSPLPPGHPAVPNDGSQPTALPPGHPPLGSKQ